MGGGPKSGWEGYTPPTTKKRLLLGGSGNGEEKKVPGSE